MHCISIQIQPEYASDFDQSLFLVQVRAYGRSPEIDQFVEKGNTYLHYNFFTEKPELLWRDLQSALYKNEHYAAVIAPVSIALLEDETHPRGFLVLHHFDQAENVDSI